MQLEWRNYRQKLLFSALFAVACAALPVCAAELCPDLIGTLDGGVASSVHVAGPYAYVDIENSGHRLAIVDVSNPALPVELGSYPVVATETLVIGDYAYVASTNGAQPGLFIIDVSDPLDPVLVSITDTGQPSLPYHVAVVGAYAYVGHWAGAMVIIDISDPDIPIPVAAHPDGYDVQVVGSYAYIVTRGASPGDGLRVVDVSNPVTPVDVGGYDLPNAEALAVGFPYAYLVVDAGNQTGLHIIDISNPAAPTEVGFWAYNGSAVRVDVEGDYAFVVVDWHLPGSLHVIDVSDPYTPTEIGTYELPSSAAEDVSVSLPHVYVAGWSDGLLNFTTKHCNSIFIDGFESGNTSAWSGTVP